MQLHIKLNNIKIRTATRVRASGSRVYNDPSYVAFRQFLTGMIAIHLDETHQTIQQPCHLIVSLTGVEDKQDLDNILKALQDCLCKDLGVIKDDKSKHIEGVFVIADKSVIKPSIEFWVIWDCALLSTTIDILTRINGTIEGKVNALKV